MKKFLWILTILATAIFLNSSYSSADGVDSKKADNALKLLTTTYRNAKIVRGTGLSPQELEEENRALIDAAETASNLKELSFTNQDNRFQHRKFSVAISADVTPIGLKNLLERIGRTLASNPGFGDFSISYTPSSKDEPIPVIEIDGGPSEEVAASILKAFTGALHSQDRGGKLSIKEKTYYSLR